MLENIFIFILFYFNINCTSFSIFFTFTDIFKELSYFSCLIEYAINVELLSIIEQSTLTGLLYFSAVLCLFSLSTVKCRMPINHRCK